jgi:hypothetical protein
MQRDKEDVCAEQCRAVMGRMMIMRTRLASTSVSSARSAFAVFSSAFDMATYTYVPKIVGQVWFHAHD